MRCLAVLVLFVLEVVVSLEQRSRPNIIFILVDDLGFDDVGYRTRDHQSDILTPGIDELANNGIKLDNYYVQRICTPSRAQLLTGRYASYTGMQDGVVWPDQTKVLPIENKLLSEQLRGCGYSTMMVGKWHLGHVRSEYTPDHRGFDNYAGILTGSADYFTRQRCFRRRCGIDWYTTEEGHVNNTWGEYAAHLYARKSIEMIQKRDPEKPFFLYLSYQSPHTPMQSTVEHMEPFMHINSKRRRTYSGMVLAMDESIRNITKYLNQAGLSENTIIVFSTDNGGSYDHGASNFPLRGQKKSLFEGGVRAVGFVHGKPLGVAGITHKGLLDISDWFPTLLRAADCPVSTGTQTLTGFDQWDAIRQKAPSPRTEILHYISRQRPKKKSSFGSSFSPTNTAALRFGPWKIITGNPGSDLWVLPRESPQHFKPRRQGQAKAPRIVRLYNIEDDPNERENLANQRPEIVQYMLRRLQMHASVSPIPKTIEVTPTVIALADPKRHNGFWVPWMDSTIVEKPNVKKGVFF